MKKYMKAHWMEYVFALLLIGIAGIGISVLFGYSFSTNDDAMLRNIVTGNYTGTPDAHLVYIMYPLGWIWKCLYQIAPMVPWYDLFMTGMHYVCWFALTVRAVQIARTRPEKIITGILTLGCIAVIDLPYLVMHQYTVLAALLASVAIFWLVTGREKSGCEYWIERVICIVLMILCLWLRKQVFFMALPIGFLILIKEILSEKKEEQKRCLKNIGIFLGVILGATILSFVIESIAYSSESWKDYKIYNEARTDIYDYCGVPKYEEYEQEYQNLGITYGDWVVMDHYDNGLINDLTSDKMVRIAEWSVAEKEEARQYYSVWRKGIYSVVEILLYNQVQPAGVILSILYVLGLLCAYKHNDKTGFVCICAMLLFQSVFVGYFMEQGRFPERISYGLYFMQICFLVGVILKRCLADYHQTKREKFWMIAIIALSLMVLSVAGLYRVRMTLNETQEVRTDIEDWNYVNEYFAANADKKYCIITKPFVFSKEAMFQNSKAESNNLIRLGSWIQNSPLEELHNERIGVNAVAESVLSGENIFLVEESGADLWWLDSYLSDKEKTAAVVETITAPGGRSFDIIEVK